MSNIKDQIEHNGFCFLPSFEPGSSASDVLSKLGRIISLGHNDAIHTLIPKSKEETTPNTYSGEYGYLHFPLHTDLANWYRPPRFIALRCVVGFREVETPILDSALIIRAIGDDSLFRALVQPRRRVQGKVSLMRLYDHLDATSLFRWDERFLMPVNKHAAEVIASVADALLNLKPNGIALSHTGDTIIINNWRMLHGRGEVPNRCRDRVIQRAYMDDIS